MKTDDIISQVDLTDRQSIEMLLFAVRNGGSSPQAATAVLQNAYIEAWLISSPLVMVKMLEAM